MALKLFENTSFEVSKIITKSYSTSFYLSSRLLEKEKREAIFAIYGFVRIADEVVDSFHQFDKSYLLKKFEEDTYYALDNNISTNLALFSFQKTIKKYNIDRAYIDAFIASMKADLNKKNYNNSDELKTYIYGSADVIGLMCLKIFCNGNESLFKKLEFQAMNLGSAFQKINFLRDLKADKKKLNRNYFPDLNNTHLNEDIKNKIIQDIEEHLKIAYSGIKMLPGRSKFAVFVAFRYYKNLLKKIKYKKADEIIERRIRISNFLKILILIDCYIKYKLRII
jgi:phytoene/squalene synthetase